MEPRNRPQGPDSPGGDEPPHVKWSQPPIEIDPNLDLNSDPPRLCGWDEPAYSTLLAEQKRQWRMVADDWIAERRTPVVALAWNGSYLGYGYEACNCIQADVPEPLRPDAFFIASKKQSPTPGAGPRIPICQACPLKPSITVKAYPWSGFP